MSYETAPELGHVNSNGEHRRERLIMPAFVGILCVSNVAIAGLAVIEAKAAAETTAAYTQLPDALAETGFNRILRLQADIDENAFWWATDSDTKGPKECTGMYTYDDHTIKIVQGSIACFALDTPKEQGDITEDV